MKIEDGCPTFPRPHSIASTFEIPAQEGMSLLDWFAGMALIGILANSSQIVEEKLASSWAYEYAEAMLKEREKQNQEEIKNETKKR